MRFIKRLVLNKKDPVSNTFAVEADGRIRTTTVRSLQLPSGTTGQRPTPVDGMIRYNTTLHDSEIYNIDGAGTGWERIKTNRQATITPQNLGVGNYVNTVFGPLAYDVDPTKPQNVMVFVDNVYQIPTTNYTLELGSGISTSTTLTADMFTNASSIHVTTTSNILIGMTVSATSGFANGTTVTSVDSITNVVGINPHATGTLLTGGTVTFAESSGVFVNFTSPAPAKQVFALLGFDGYTPPNS
jgi:hypothetical protein